MMTHFPTPAGRIAAVALLGLLFPVGTHGTAFAQGPGVRVGVSTEPDQFYFGMHYEAGPLADRLWFRPNLEVGLGDDATLTCANFEFAYKLPLTRTPWSTYFGGGPALNIFHRRGKTDTGGGFNILLGLAHSQGFFTEVKVGAIDSPSFKFGVGYTFH